MTENVKRIRDNLLPGLLGRDDCCADLRVRDDGGIDLITYDVTPLFSAHEIASGEYKALFLGRVNAALEKKNMEMVKKDLGHAAAVQPERPESVNGAPTWRMENS